MVFRTGRARRGGASDYQRFLQRNTLLCSISAVGHCGDNAAGMLKRERTNHRRYRTWDEIRADVFDYIERFHNPKMRRRVVKQDKRFLAVFKPSAETG